MVFFKCDTLRLVQFTVFCTCLNFGIALDFFKVVTLTTDHIKIAEEKWAEQYGYPTKATPLSETDKLAKFVKIKNKRWEFEATSVFNSIVREFGSEGKNLNFAIIYATGNIGIVGLLTAKKLIENEYLHVHVVRLPRSKVSTKKDYELLEEEATFKECDNIQATIKQLIKQYQEKKMDYKFTMYGIDTEKCTDESRPLDEFATISGQYSVYVESYSASGGDKNMQGLDGKLNPVTELIKVLRDDNPKKVVSVCFPANWTQEHGIQHKDKDGKLVATGQYYIPDVLIILAFPRQSLRSTLSADVQYKPKEKRLEDAAIYLAIIPDMAECIINALGDPKLGKIGANEYEKQQYKSDVENLFRRGEFQQKEMSYFYWKTGIKGGHDNLVIMDGVRKNKAWEMALLMHGGYNRKFKERPYIGHPADVAQLVVKHVPAQPYILKTDRGEETISYNMEDIVAAALLHDTLEEHFLNFPDPKSTKNKGTRQQGIKLIGTFGPNVLNLVWELTDAEFTTDRLDNYAVESYKMDKKIEQIIKAKQGEYSRKVFLIKLADKLNNLSCFIMECKYYIVLLAKHKADFQACLESLGQMRNACDALAIGETFAEADVESCKKAWDEHYAKANTCLQAVVKLTATVKSAMTNLKKYFVYTGQLLLTGKMSIDKTPGGTTLVDKLQCQLLIALEVLLNAKVITSEYLTEKFCIKTPRWEIVNFLKYLAEDRLKLETDRLKQEEDRLKVDGANATQEAENLGERQRLLTEDLLKLKDDPFKLDRLNAEAAEIARKTESIKNKKAMLDKDRATLEADSKIVQGLKKTGPAVIFNTVAALRISRKMTHLPEYKVFFPSE